MSSGYAAALVTVFSWTISIFILARLSRLVTPYQLNKASLFFGTLLLGIVVCLIDKISPLQLFTLPDSSGWALLGISGIVGKAIGDYCGFSCLRIMGPRRRSMIATITPGLVWVVALLLLEEKINFAGVAGIFLTSIALYCLLNITTEQKEVKEEQFGSYRKGIFMGLSGALLTAIAFILAKKALTGNGSIISAFHGTWIRIFSAFLALWIVDAMRNKKSRFISEIIKNRTKTLLLFLGIVFGTVIGLSFSLVAITRMEVAVAYTIFALTPLMVIIISAIFFRKKISWQAWGLSILAISGTVLLVWRKELTAFL